MKNRNFLLCPLTMILLTSCALFKDAPPQYVFDPVCKMKVEKSDAYKWKYKGQVYYFDNYNCKQAFKMHPDTYLTNNCPDK